MLSHIAKDISLKYTRSVKKPQCICSFKVYLMTFCKLHSLHTLKRETINYKRELEECGRGRLSPFLQYCHTFSLS